MQRSGVTVVDVRRPPRMQSVQRTDEPFGRLPLVQEPDFRPQELVHAFELWFGLASDAGCFGVLERRWTLAAAVRQDGREPGNFPACNLSSIPIARTPSDRTVSRTRVDG